MVDATTRVTLEVTLAQVDHILLVLGKEKFSRVADLILDLRSQAQRQIMAASNMALRPNGSAEAEAGALLPQ